MCLGTANLAIDGNTNPLLFDGSVTETLDSSNPWWLIQLSPKTSTVRTVRIYPRKAEVWIPMIISYTIKGLDVYPEGTYRLQISSYDSSNSSMSGITSALSFNAEASVVQRVIESSIQGIGVVAVNRTLLPICGVYTTTGCGDGVEHGFGYTYSLIFKSIYQSYLTVQIIDEQFVGGVVVNGAFGETSTFRTSALVTHVNITRQGYYAKDTSLDTNVDIDTTNTWLTPYYLMLFTSSPPDSLDESMLQAVWYAKYDTVTMYASSSIVVTIVLPYDVLNVQYVKIQRDTSSTSTGTGILSLAEVEIFSYKINSLPYYDQGLVIQPTALTNPMQGEESFKNQFDEMFYDGKWVLEIKQHSNSTIIKDIDAYGTISDVVIVITDMIGVVRSYRQDLVAEILTLPQHGQLYETLPAKSSNPLSTAISTAAGSAVATTVLSTQAADISSMPNYNDWRNQFEVINTSISLHGVNANQNQPKNMISPDDVCILYDSKDNITPLQATIGLQTTVDFLTSSNTTISYYYICTTRDTYRKYGDTPVKDKYLISDDRYLLYQPNPNYLGADTMTYRIIDGTTEQLHSSPTGRLNEVSQGLSGSMSGKITSRNGIHQQDRVTSVNEVTIHTRYCRKFAKQTAVGYLNPIHPLCSCASSESSITPSDIKACDLSRFKTCQNSKTKSNYIAMCVACEDILPILIRSTPSSSNSTYDQSSLNSTFYNATSQYNLSYNVSISQNTTISLNVTIPQSEWLSIPGYSSCLAETNRVVSFLTTRGLCSSSPMMDCSTEVITLNGHSRVSYMSLTPPITANIDAFTATGDSFGGQGWYTSSTLN